MTKIWEGMIKQLFALVLVQYLMYFAKQKWYWIQLMLHPISVVPCQINQRLESSRPNNYNVFLTSGYRGCSSQNNFLIPESRLPCQREREEGGGGGGGSEAQMPKIKVIINWLKWNLTQVIMTIKAFLMQNLSLVALLVLGIWHCQISLGRREQVIKLGYLPPENGFNF